MHPVLFDIPIFGNLTIYTYGALVAAGFLAGIGWVIYETKRLGLDTGKSLDLAFYIIISAIIGSRFLFLIVTDPSRLISQPWSLFMVWEGGLVFHGGLIAAVIVGIIFFWRKKMPVMTYLDVFAPAIAIGHFFGRIGCLMAGCCHGRPANSVWYTITFPENPNSFAPANIPLYPTQPMEFVGLFIIFMGLVLFRKHKKFEGQLFALYLIAYAVLRFFNEFFRGDVERGFIIHSKLSTGQGVSIILFAIGAGMLVYGYKKIRRG